MQQIPYTYLLKFTNPETDEIKFYYGSKVSKNANPSTFWQKYHTSSNIIKDLISKFGENCFEYEIRCIFNSPNLENNIKLAKRCEQRILKYFKVRTNSQWINESTNTFGDYYASYKTKEHRSKLGKSGLDNVAKRKEVREKISNSAKGRVRSEESKQKQSQTRLGIKPWNYENKWTDEQKKNLKSESRQNALKEIQMKAHATWFGSNHTKESKKAISEGISTFYKQNPDKAFERGKKLIGNVERNKKVAKSRTGKKWIVNVENIVKIS